MIGSPIAHSLSPAMHRAAYSRLGLDWGYSAHDTDESALPGFLAGLDERWRGLSLTMPLKYAVVPLLDDLTEMATRTGVVNTVVLAGGRRSGDNTDVPGMVAALTEAGVPVGTHAVVVGAGATAVSALAALATLGVTHVHLKVRDVSRAARASAAGTAFGVEVSVSRLDESWPRRTDVVVSTVPGDAGDVVPDPLLGSSGTVFDVGYVPWPTPLALRAGQQGVRVVSGLDLLAHQAALQVTAMTGGSVPAEVLRDAALAQLRPPPGSGTEESTFG